MVLNRTWGRLHINGAFAVVDQHESEDGSVAYRAGALRFGEPARLHMDIGDFWSAQWCAESEACRDGHDCSGCGDWMSVPERRKVPRFQGPVKTRGES